MAKHPTAQINPLIYIVIGVVIFVVSLIVNANSKTNFIVFIVAGAGMTVFGLIKFMIQFARRAQGDTEIEPVQHQTQQQMHHTQSHSQQQSGHQGHQNPQHKTYAERMQEQQLYKTSKAPMHFCSHCGSRVGHANFCPTCGVRLK